jgi:hypothetical protein
MLTTNHGRWPMIKAPAMIDPIKRGRLNLGGTDRADMNL